MRILIILGHPREGSFNHAIAKTAAEVLKENGHEIIYHDLYKEHFNPIIEYQEIPKNAQIDSILNMHCKDLSSADGIIIVHPNWWGQPPAILKGWIDRVIRPGIAYEFSDDDNGEGVPKGLLKAEAALVFNTSDTAEDRELNVFGDPLETIWKNCIFSFSGVENFYRKVYRIVVTSTFEEREKWLEDVKETINKYFPTTVE